ncbi:MAG: hypothetical protein Q8P00_05880 [Dehalococcoidia bacterium]|nr:hypothetical protein [Dehalococcoidia bacterium]
MIANAPAPRIPVLPEIKDVEQLLPLARSAVKRKETSFMVGLDLKGGERVLIVSDTTSDALLQEALAIAIRESGNHLDVIQLEGFPGRTDPVELLDGMFSNNWWPEWVWEAANKYDLVLAMSFMKLPHTPNLPLAEKVRSDVIEVTRYTFSPDYENFPLEIRDALDKKTWDLLVNSSKIKITDLEGTDLELTYTKEEWDRTAARNIPRVGKPYLPGHLMVPAPTRGMEGKLVTSSITFGGPVPRTTLTIEHGQAVKVVGGGKFGQRLTESFEKYKNATMPKYPGPGVNWISTLALCTHPRAIPSPDFEHLTGSARIHAWTTGHRRSGVIHLSLGESVVSQTYKVIRHVDLFFPTVVADGRKVVEMGHLLALDDPEVQKLAAKYGDPKKLLTEAWIPAVSGVNAP